MPVDKKQLGAELEVNVTYWYKFIDVFFQHFRLVLFADVVISLCVHLT